MLHVVTFSNNSRFFPSNYVSKFMYAPSRKCEVAFYQLIGDMIGDSPYMTFFVRQMVLCNTFTGVSSCMDQQYQQFWEKLKNKTEFC